MRSKNTPAVDTGLSSTPSSNAFSRRQVLLASLGAAGFSLVSGLLPKVGSQAHASPALKPGGKLTVGHVGQGARGFVNPHIMGDDAVAMINQNLVFEGLTQYENDGSMSMCLAESMTAIDGDTSYWEIKIKPGVVFHDGQPLTAKDVIHSMKAISAEGTVSRGYLGPVENYEEIDPLTVRVKLGDKRNWFPEAMSSAFSGIIPANFDPKKPVGTGAFRYDRSVEMESVTLTRHENYHGPKAVVDEVTLRIFADESALLNAITAGQVDIVNGLSPAMADEYEADERFQLYNSPTGKCYPIHMRSDIEPFKEVKLRQAMRMVLDREAVVNSGYNGYATIANDIYAPQDTTASDALVRTRDVEGAKKLIEEAGLTGKTIELTMVDDMATALILSEDAKLIGLNVEVRKLEPAAFFNEEFIERPFHGGDYYPPAPFFMTSSLLDGPDPGIPTLRWVDDEYLALWKKGNESADPEEVAKIIRQLKQILFDRGPLIIAIFVNELGLYRTGLGGIPEGDYNGTGIYRSLRFVGELA